MNKYNLLDIIKCPIITDKTTKLLEENQYSFTVKSKANKLQIKKAIEDIFNVKVINVNTCNNPTKKRRVGKFVGLKAQYKKAIITLDNQYSINLFPES